MRVTLNALHRIYATGEHAAFTDLCHWRSSYYVAFRRAYSHGIVPAGSISLARWDGTRRHAPRWESCGEIALPCGDCRDPKFYATPEALFLVCGVYLPMPQGTGSPSVLRPVATENVLITHTTFTTDGLHWGPLLPVLRPNYWGWSCLSISNAFLMASYHVGTPGEVSSSIALWSGQSPRLVGAYGTIYDGASHTTEGRQYRYAQSIPSEPVLYQPIPGMLACCLRTENTMEIGVSRAPYQDDWRWWDTGMLIHPSAMLRTRQGWLLAGRALSPIAPSSPGQRRDARAHLPLRYETTTALWHVEGQYVEPLLTLPSGGDTGYAGLCAGTRRGEYLVSFYSQHAYAQGPTQTTLPSADVFVATVRLD